MAAFEFTLHFYDPVSESFPEEVRSIEWDGEAETIKFSEVVIAPANYQFTGVSKKGKIAVDSNFKVLTDGTLTIYKEE